MTFQAAHTFEGTAVVSCASASSFRPSDFFTDTSLVSRLLHILRTDCSTVRRDALWVISNISHCAWQEARRQSPQSSVSQRQPQVRVGKRSSRVEYHGDHRVAVAAAPPPRPSKRKMQDFPAAKRQRRRGELERRAAIRGLLGQGCVAVLAKLLVSACVRAGRHHVICSCQPKTCDDLVSFAQSLHWLDSTTSSCRMVSHVLLSSRAALCADCFPQTDH